MVRLEASKRGARGTLAGSLLEMSGGNSVVESLPSKQMVAGSSPVPRSIAQP
jgi:hypothetical protein